MTLATTSPGVAAQDTNFEAATQLTQDDAAAAFLSKWSEEDPEKASEAPEGDESSTDEVEEDNEAEEVLEIDEESDTDHQEDAEEPPEDADEEPKSKEPKKVLEDTAIVKIKVGDEELDVSVKDLKRLYGQEAALTRKSQEASAKRKEADATQLKAQATLEKMYQKAADRWKPYAEVDMLMASKQLDTETFAALRKESQAAYEDFRFITEEADSFVKNAQAQQQQNLQEQAKESVKVLKETIPNWSPKLYDDIRAFAISSGLSAEGVNNLVDPAAIQILHKARLYDLAKKVVMKKKIVQPKNVLKQSVTTSPRDVKSDMSAKAKAKFATSGSVDDAADLFLSRWASGD